MRKFQTLLMMSVVGGLALAATDSEAKRVGASSKSSAASTRHAEEPAKGTSVTIVPTFRSSVAGAAAGTAAGAAAAATTATDQAQLAAAKAAAAEEQRLSKLSDFERKAEIDEAAKRAEQAAKAAEMRWNAEQEAKAAADKHRQEMAEARRRADEDRAAEEKRQAVEREKSCIIKPAMSDAEIEHCKWAWSFPPP